jgi:ABC-type branched-subunit amino acid transport system substrate-binding protein
VAQAVEGADAVALITGPEQTLQFLLAAQQTGAKPNVLVDAALMRQSYIQQSGGASGPTKQMHLVSWFPAISDSRWKPFTDAMTTFGKDVDVSSDTAQGSWISMLVFEDVAKRVQGEINAKSFKAALDAASNVNVGNGVVGTLDFTKPFDVSTYARFFNRDVYFLSVEGGTYGAFKDGKPFDTSGDFRR